MMRQKPNQPPTTQITIDAIDPRDDGCVDIPAKSQLRALAESIRCDGLIQPLLVRPTASGRYQIVQGNRRLMACRMLGMQAVDAEVLPMTPFEHEASRLLEDLHTGSWHYMQVAAMLHTLHTVHGMSMEALAQALAMPVESIREKLNLMTLGLDVRAALASQRLPERLAQCLLKLPDDEARRTILQQMAEEHLNVRDTELLISSVQRQLQGHGHGEGGRRLTIIRDERLYLNAIRTLVMQMQEAGLPAELSESEVGGCLQLNVRVSRRHRRSARYQHAASQEVRVVAGMQ